MCVCVCVFELQLNIKQLNLLPANETIAGTKSLEMEPSGGEGGAS